MRRAKFRRVFIHLRNGSHEVREADDLKRLSVLAEPGTDIAASLGELGSPDPDGAHVWLLVDALRSAAAATVTDDVDAWRAGFDGMIAYATKSGWTSPDGASVRAHLTHP